MTQLHFVSLNHKYHQFKVLSVTTLYDLIDGRQTSNGLLQSCVDPLI